MKRQHHDRGLGRDMVAIAGGMAVGLVGSRLLPPVMAQVAGAVRARAGEDPFERLKQDHQQILSLLGRMRAASDVSTAGRMSRFLRLKRTLAKHALAEEDVVYPALHSQAAAAEAARRLYVEHGEMKVLLYLLETSLDDDAAWERHVGSLHELIARHIEDEETTQFPQLRARLDPERVRMLAGQIRREEAMVL